MFLKYWVCLLLLVFIGAGLNCSRWSSKSAESSEAGDDDDDNDDNDDDDDDDNDDTSTLDSDTETDSEQEALPHFFGLKLYQVPDDPETALDRIIDLNITAVFIDLKVAEDETFVALLHETDLKIYVIFPVFFNNDALMENSDLCAVDETGACAQEDWLTMICPSRWEHRDKVLDDLRDVIDAVHPHGVSIDFIRHFVFWESVTPETPFESFKHTCFCDHCVNGFQELSGVGVDEQGFDETIDRSNWILEHHFDQWENWKTHIITSMATEMVNLINGIDPAIQTNLHGVPWGKDDFAGAILWTVGQDYAALGQVFDYISPMTYASMVGQDAKWIHHTTLDIYEQSNGQIIPSVQVSALEGEDSEDILSVAEFEQSIEQALLSPSSGLVLWKWQWLAQDSSRYDAAKTLLTPYR